MRGKTIRRWAKQIMVASLVLPTALFISCNHRPATTEKFVEGGQNYVRVKKYHTNGTLKVNATLREVKDTFLVDGFVEEFDQEGNTISIRSFVNGIMTGSNYYYEPSGAIEAYEFYDSEEFLFYRASFDGKNIKEEEGNIFPIVAAHPYNPKDSVRIYAINTPYRERSLVITRRQFNQKDTILYLSNWKSDFLDVDRKIIHDTIAIKVDYLLRDGAILSDSLLLP